MKEIYIWYDLKVVSLAISCPFLVLESLGAWGVTPHSLRGFQQIKKLSAFVCKSKNVCGVKKALILTSILPTVPHICVYFAGNTSTWIIADISQHRIYRTLILIRRSTGSSELDL